MRTVYIGVREAGTAPGFVRYHLRATALPRVIKDGMIIPTALPACVGTTEELDFCRQYYVVDVGCAATLPCCGAAALRCQARGCTPP